MAIYEVMRGIVLRETETKEADKILTVLSPEKGRVAVIARGARRRGSKLAAASQLLAYSEMTVYQSGDWHMLTEASTLELFRGLRTDIARLSLASYFAELAETAAGENLPAPEITSLLLNALYAIGTLQKPAVQVKAAYELRLLCLSGYAPRLEDCARCGGEAGDGVLFDPREGTLLCPACRGEGDRGLLSLDAAALAAARHIAWGDAKRLYAFSLSEGAMGQLAAACEAFSAQQWERGFRTLSYWKSLGI